MAHTIFKNINITWTLKMVKGTVVITTKAYANFTHWDKICGIISSESLDIFLYGNH